MIQKIKIERSKRIELNEIMSLFIYARNFMIHSGNPNQWINGYPSEKQIFKDIETTKDYFINVY